MGMNWLLYTGLIYLGAAYNEALHWTRGHQADPLMVLAYLSLFLVTFLIWCVLAWRSQRRKSEGLGNRAYTNMVRKRKDYEDSMRLVVADSQQGKMVLDTERK